ncbi:class I SAM-dependent methyltransferase [Amycolatopsis sp. NPDC058986]|uniref:class I SAM-dependent methyltransferase n=1 Tax=unclassified Amycolatopsis TaxID=2618356 RepID=UPI0036728F2E
MSDPTMAQLHDELAGTYDENTFHATIADALVDGLAGEPAPGLLLDVAAGTGHAAFAALRLSPGRVLAVDISPGMIAQAEAKAATLDPDRRITWQVGSAVPMPAEDGSADAVLCASALHFLGATALRDWLRVLRPGGVAAFSLPLAARFSPSGKFAAFVPADLPIPDTAEEAAALATGAGFTDVVARRLNTEDERPRSAFVVHARAPR